MADETAEACWAEIPESEGMALCFPPCVLAARLEATEDGRRLVPIAPAEIAARWPGGWNAGLPCDWVQVAGPPRLLGYDEHARIAAEALAAGNRTTLDRKADGDAERGTPE